VAGVHDQLLLQQMRRGINGNLWNFLNGKFGGTGRNMGKGQDLIFADCRVEVKQIHDCTFSKYYPAVGNDWRKLAYIRSHGSVENLFLIVFFVQLPNYEYPVAESRKVNVSWIEDQYKKVRLAINAEPVWPAVSPPFKKPLYAPSRELQDAVIERWKRKFSRVSQFDFKSQLDDAAVAVSIWEYPK
jgi:hypothetical protein